jgi:NAD(P)-dependent dehydrogenase (short-subunit alcohol dehydrogenase family)
MPGVLETPMTMANLTLQQISEVKAATPFDRLPDLDSVTGLVAFFCSKENSSVTGQSVAVDLGFSNACLI